MSWLNPDGVRAAPTTETDPAGSHVTMTATMAPPASPGNMAGVKEIIQVPKHGSVWMATHLEQNISMLLGVLGKLAQGLPGGRGRQQ